MAKAISSFRNRIIPHVPGCPIPKIDEAVVDAMRQLCEETNCYAKTIGATGDTPEDAFPYVFPIVLGEIGNYYTVTVDLSEYTELDGYEPIAVVYFVVDEIEETLEYMDAENAVTDLLEILPSDKRFYRFDSTPDLVLFPYSTSAETEVVMIITLSLKPADGSTSVADDFWKWKDAICALATSNLQLIPNRDWSDIDRAMFNYRIYEDKRSQINFNRRALYKLQARSSGGYI